MLNPYKGKNTREKCFLQFNQLLHMDKHESGDFCYTGYGNECP
jgi:hypothetical protein